VADFEFELSVQNLKLKVRGTRADVPLIKEQFARQLGSLVEPAAALAAGEADAPAVIDATPTPAAASRAKRTGARRARTSGEKTAPLTWEHDPAKWGRPKQSWSVPEKVIWVLHVMTEELGRTSFTSPEIGGAFNARFEDAVVLSQKHLSSNLKRMKTLVSEANGGWVLLQKGREQAQALIAKKDEHEPGSSGA
jgi:hypothetical protein